MKHIATVIFLLSLALLAQLSQSPTRLEIVGELGEVTQLCLEAEGVQVQWTGTRTVLTIEDKERAVDGFINALASHHASLAIFEHNIANAHTTKTVDGTPYRRQYPLYDEKGKVEFIAQDCSDFNWVYSPGHPDSQKEGPRAGYVAKPNVNVLSEKVAMDKAWRQDKLARMLLAELDPEVLVPEEILWGKVEAPLKKVAPKQRTVLSSLNHFSLDILKTRKTETDERRLQDSRLQNFQALAQNNAVSSGQSSVAMCLNAMTGGHLTDQDIDHKYGFHLLDALKGESHGYGVGWRDAGNLCAQSFVDIREALEADLPVIVAVNGPNFSESGRGNIVVIIGYDGSVVRYADPTDGQIKEQSWMRFVKAPQHPDGNFVFLPSIVGPNSNPYAMINRPMGPNGLL